MKPNLISNMTYQEYCHYLEGINKELLAVCKDALEGLYVEHAECCSLDGDEKQEPCPYMETYRELQRVIDKAERSIT